MEKKQEKRISPLLLFLIISLLFHLSLVGIFYLIPKGGNEIPPESKVVWVEPQLNIADIEKPAVEKRPEQAKYAGQYDSSVKEETVARPKPKVKEVKENPNSSDDREAASASKPQKKSAQQNAQEMTKPEKKQKVAKNELKTTPTKTPTDLSLKPEDVFKKIPEKKIKEPAKSYAGSPGSGLSYGKPSSPDLFNHDYYPDYKVGGKTYLNVMKLQDIGYFVKMKRILKMRWNPVPPIRDYLASNRLSVGSIECVVGVSLDSSGKVSELFVIHSSGLGAYDQEALQTIRDSSPFSAPPAQFLKQGQLRMSWTFTVYL